MREKSSVSMESLTKQSKSLNHDALVSRGVFIDASPKQILHDRCYERLDYGCDE